MHHAVWIIILALSWAHVAAQNICGVGRYNSYTGFRVMREWRALSAPSPAARFFDKRPVFGGSAATQRGLENSAADADLLKSGAPRFEKLDPSLTTVVILRCEFGHPVGEVVVPESQLFNSTHCTTNDNEWCVRIARRKKYLSQPVWSLRMPGSLIGGVYTNCSSETGRDSFELCEYAPIQIEAWRGWHSVVHSDAVFFRLPLARTPAIMEKTYPQNGMWAESVDFNEIY